MAKLPRATQTIFASTAGANQIAEFGSLAASAPATYSGTTITAAIVQTLSNFASGWFGAVIGSNSPAIEDMNALFWLITYQIAYGFQAGVPEWDAGTTYFKGSLVNSGGKIYVSLTDSNINNALSSNTNWSIGGTTRTVTTTDVALITDSMVRCNPTSGSFVETLPLLSTTPLGTQITFKNIATNGNTVTLTGSIVGDLIDSSNTYVLNSDPVMDSITVRSAGTVWDII